MSGMSRRLAGHSLSAKPTALSSDPQAEISLGNEVMRVEPHWGMEVKLMFALGILPMVGLAAILDLEDFTSAEFWLPILMLLSALPMLLLIKPKTIIFCDHGLALIHLVGKPTLIPYRSIVRCGGGVILTAERAWQYGVGYANEDEIERCFKAAGRLAVERGPFRIDSKVLWLSCLMLMPIVIVGGYLWLA